MQANYEIVTGIVIATIFFLLAGFFIFIIVAYSISRKKKFIKETQQLQETFKEQLLKSELEIQEQTFDSISKEIHDNIGQILSFAKLQLNIMAQGEQLDKQLLFDARDSVTKALVDLRDIAKGLSTERLRNISLTDVAHEEITRINRSGILHAIMSVEGTEEPMPEEKKLILFRIIQESLQNILKHAQATTIQLNFYYYSDTLRITITDDGVGFDVSKFPKKDGLGLQNIISRAALIGGEAKITSSINSGTVITIISPYA